MERVKQKLKDESKLAKTTFMKIKPILTSHHLSIVTKQRLQQCYESYYMSVKHGHWATEWKAD